MMNEWINRKLLGRWLSREASRRFRTCWCRMCGRRVSRHSPYKQIRARTFLFSAFTSANSINDNHRMIRSKMMQQVRNDNWRFRQWNSDVKFTIVFFSLYFRFLSVVSWHEKFAIMENDIAMKSMGDYYSVNSSHFVLCLFIFLLSIIKLYCPFIHKQKSESNRRRRQQCHRKVFALTSFGFPVLAEQTKNVFLEQIENA